MIRSALFRLFLSAVFLSVCAGSSAYAQTATRTVRIAVVNAHYDDPGRVLSAFDIPYTRVAHKELENPEMFAKYDVIFFPCGIGIYPKTSITILSRGTKLAGVSLTDEYYKIDEERAADNISDFVEKGGVAVFSDYSAMLLRQSLDIVSFYPVANDDEDDFPNLGFAGTVIAEPQGDYAAFFRGKTESLQFNHAGWSVVREFSDGDTWLRGKCMTPLGEREAVIAGYAPYKKGLVIYTAFHENSPANELMRFIAIRASHAYYLDKNRRYITAWDLSAQSSVIDVTAGDVVRSYDLALDGRGTVFAFFPGGRWFVEVFDGKRRPLFAGYRGEGVFKLDLVNEGRDVLVKVFSLNPGEHRMYSVWSASGLRLFPYYKKLAAGIIILGLFIVYMKFIRRERYDATPGRGIDEPGAGSDEETR